MSLASPPPTVRTWTAEEILSLPDDGIHRELVRGELREQPVTFRSRKHSMVEATVAHFLVDWLKTQPEPRGIIHSGEAGFRLRHDPVTFVGVDVAYASADLVASTAPKLPFYDGAPVLAVEILSPSDRHEAVVEKVSLYLEAGTVVWVIDPDFRIVLVHRPGQIAQSFNESQELSGEPELPGFRVRVADLFV